MPDPDRFTVITTPNPHHGPGGKPFTVRAVGRLGTAEENYWTAADALDARDRFLDAGYDQVRVIGLATTAAGTT